MRRLYVTRHDPCLGKVKEGLDGREGELDVNDGKSVQHLTPGLMKEELVATQYASRDGKVPQIGRAWIPDGGQRIQAQGKERLRDPRPDDEALPSIPSSNHSNRNTY